jgi:hypothetical protein
MGFVVGDVSTSALMRCLVPNFSDRQRAEIRLLNQAWPSRGRSLATRTIQRVITRPAPVEGGGGGAGVLTPSLWIPYPAITVTVDPTICSINFEIMLGANGPYAQLIHKDVSLTFTVGTPRLGEWTILSSNPGLSTFKVGVAVEVGDRLQMPLIGVP